LEEQTLGFRASATERSWGSKNGRVRVGRDARLWSSGGRARKVKRLKRAVRPRPELTIRVAMRGTAGRVGASRRGAGTRPIGLVEKREGGEGSEKSLPDHPAGEKL
jgi:hypothetical protein